MRFILGAMLVLGAAACQTPPSYLTIDSVPGEATLKFPDGYECTTPCPVTVKQQMIEWWGPIINEYYAGTAGNGSTTITSDIDWLGSIKRQTASSRARITHSFDFFHILDVI